MTLSSCVSCQDSAESLLRAIKTYDYSGCPDDGLRSNLASLLGKWESRDPEDLLPPVFALVDEAVRRRLGAWRLFDTMVDCGELESYRHMASNLVFSADGQTRAGLVDQAGLPFPIFHQHLQHLLDATALGDDEQLIVSALIYVRYASSGHTPWDVYLPAEFYRALDRKDTAGVLAFRPTSEQLLAGVHLFRGRIVEMNAGEGKTVAAAFPAVMHALLGRRVHIATANDYLAARDLDLLGPVYRSLGLTADAVLEHMMPEERRDAYSKAIVYGNMREFGFDFLRDNLKMSEDDRVQRPLQVLIVDEADHALIDQAQTPMIISGGKALRLRAFARTKRAIAEMVALQEVAARPLERQMWEVSPQSRKGISLLAKLLLAQPDNPTLRRRLSQSPRLRQRLVARIFPDGADYPDDTLTAGLYYYIHPDRRQVALTQEGQAILEGQMGAFFDAQDLEEELSNLAADTSLTLASRRLEMARLTKQLALRCNLGNQVYQMLWAFLLLRKNVDYIVTEDTVVLIDPHTGRRLPDNRYREGLQPALEAKEGVKINPERQTLAQISVQGFVNGYGTVAGMTGTARAAAAEFRQRYSLEVEAVPTSRLGRRQDLPSRVYGTTAEKLAAVVDEVEQNYRVGRPVLVGAGNIKQAEGVSGLLAERKIPHKLLSAVTSHEESQVVSRAGTFGAVTVATNMAGRGTDIILDGDLDYQVAAAYLAHVQRLLDGGASQVVLRCYSREESEYLIIQASSSPELQLNRIAESDGCHLVAVRRRCAESVQTGPQWECGLDFGLGLYVIGVDINASPRIDLQLQGRSGRQGSFGWSRFFLSVEDLVLSSELRSSLADFLSDKVDSGGRGYIQGEQWEHWRRVAQREADQEAETQRNLLQDYSNVLDSQTNLYYRRRQVMLGTTLMEHCRAVAREVGNRLVARYFSGYQGQDYARQFNQMCEELQEDYGGDWASLWGVGLDQLAARLEQELASQLDWARLRLGDTEFQRLARVLWLQTGDELWRDHLNEVQELMLLAGLGSYGHKSAVADYVIEAFHRWESFQQEVDQRFLSRLLTFPVGEGVGTPADGAVEVNLIPDVAAILGQ